ncbi:hypothetical protein FRACA_1880006 [Frankia canadensis]|uniref:Uncharacterized protein n=1 Tax=Frankia canadensis TaxID=1836972 RepID=A0A2I2KP03_9ACTN|nr:hypothetical protein FRACA_1880006 [Frankia canadensis]SOU54693.1 hypothetical protein FRACA_1880006 [Frankia canadensis]
MAIPLACREGPVLARRAPGTGPARRAAGGAGPREPAAGLATRVADPSSEALHLSRTATIFSVVAAISRHPRDTYLLCVEE